jgi:hypothetical protein
VPLLLGLPAFNALLSLLQIAIRQRKRRRPSLGCGCPGVPAGSAAALRSQLNDHSGTSRTLRFVDGGSVGEYELVQLAEAVWWPDFERHGTGGTNTREKATRPLARATPAATRARLGRSARFRRGFPNESDRHRVERSMARRRGARCRGLCSVDANPRRTKIMKARMDPYEAAPEECKLR